VWARSTKSRSLARTWLLDRPCVPLSLLRAVAAAAEHLNIAEREPEPASRCRVDVLADRIAAGSGPISIGAPRFELGTSSPPDSSSALAGGPAEVAGGGFATRFGGYRGNQARFPPCLGSRTFCRLAAVEAAGHSLIRGALQAPRRSVRRSSMPSTLAAFACAGPKAGHTSPLKRTAPRGRSDSIWMHGLT
jgi:hypothetical protein